MQKSFKSLSPAFSFSLRCYHLRLVSQVISNHYKWIRCRKVQFPTLVCLGPQTLHYFLDWEMFSLLISCHWIFTWRKPTGDEEMVALMIYYLEDGLKEVDFWSTMLLICCVSVLSKFYIFLCKMGIEVSTRVVVIKLSKLFSTCISYLLLC